jgi:hypothetical protein
MNLTKLADFLTAKELMAKPFCEYEEQEIEALVAFIIENYADQRPCPLLVDHAQRLIVPANADKHQLRVAIRWIQAMLDYTPPENSITEVTATNEIPHVWDTYGEG